MILNFVTLTNDGHELFTVEIEDEDADSLLSELREYMSLIDEDDPEERSFDAISGILDGYNYIMKESELITL